jgi:hypothetical protein
MAFPDYSIKTIGRAPKESMPGQSDEDKFQNKLVDQEIGRLTKKIDDDTETYNEALVPYNALVEAVNKAVAASDGGKPGEIIDPDPKANKGEPWTYEAAIAELKKRKAELQKVSDRAKATYERRDMLAKARGAANPGLIYGEHQAPEAPSQPTAIPEEKPLPETSGAGILGNVAAGFGRLMGGGGQAPGAPSQAGQGATNAPDPAMIVPGAERFSHPELIRASLDKADVRGHVKELVMAGVGSNEIGEILRFYGILNVDELDDIADALDKAGVPKESQSKPAGQEAGVE